jgi:N-acetylglucosaminyldiphosphoundecaprenol N-acetyl-beta-D-mannosaminyltransferase
MKALSPVSGTSTDTVSFLGLTLQPKSLHEMNLLVEEGVRDHRNWIIANHNLHSLYLLHRHPELREFYSGVQWTHIDGMPLVALGRLYGYPLERRHRVTLVDWTYPLMELAASKGWRVFHLGSSNGSAEKGAARQRIL